MGEAKRRQQLKNQGEQLLPNDPSWKMKQRENDATLNLDAKGRVLASGKVVLVRKTPK